MFEVHCGDPVYSATLWGLHLPYGDKTWSPQHKSWIFRLKMLLAKRKRQSMCIYVRVCVSTYARWRWGEAAKTLWDHPSPDCCVCQILCYHGNSSGKTLLCVLVCVRMCVLHCRSKCRRSLLSNCEYQSVRGEKVFRVRGEVKWAIWEWSCLLFWDESLAWRHAAHIKRKTTKGGKKRERTLQRSHPSLQMTAVLILAACLCGCKLYVLRLQERRPTLDCTAVCTSIKVEGAVCQDTVWPAITAAVLVGRYTFSSVSDAVLWVVSLNLIQIWAIVTLF